MPHNRNLVAVVGWCSCQRTVATNETPPPLPASNLASPIRESSLSGLISAGAHELFPLSDAGCCMLGCSILGGWLAFTRCAAAAHNPVGSAAAGVLRRPMFQLSMSSHPRSPSPPKRATDPFATGTP